MTYISPYLFRVLASGLFLHAMGSTESVAVRPVHNTESNVKVSGNFLKREVHANPFIDYPPTQVHVFLPGSADIASTKLDSSFPQNATV